MDKDTVLVGVVFKETEMKTAFRALMPLTVLICATVLPAQPADRFVGKCPKPARP